MDGIAINRKHFMSENRVIINVLAATAQIQILDVTHIVLTVIHNPYLGES